MEAIKMSEDINLQRRRFFGTAATSIAAAQLILSGSAHAQPSKAKSAELPKIKPGANTSFGPLKQIDAGLLNIGYAEAGPADGPAVILLHGWPYDIYSYVDVTPMLAAAGYRVIVPYLRGYGTTRFLSNETVRSGQPSAVAVDTIALMDALKIEKATLAGFDWGARTANIIAALWPERCKAMVSVSGYLIAARNPARCRCRQRLSFNGGTSFISPPNAAAPATTNTGMTSQNSFGSSPRRSGSLMMPHSIALPRRSTTRITSLSSFIIIAGGSAWLRASRNMAIWIRALPKALASPCPPLRLKATPTGHHTRTPVPMPGNSRENMRTGPSRAASGTICLRKPRRPLPKLSSTSPVIDCAD